MKVSKAAANVMGPTVRDIAEHPILLDAFAEARRTWDELVAVQPDVMAAGGNLDAGSLAEFERRVGAHREAMDLLADAFEADEQPTTGAVP
jgi:hypothetical protein